MDKVVTTGNTHSFPLVFKAATRITLALVLASASILLSSCRSGDAENEQIAEDMLPDKFTLFDGENLGNWKVTDFGGQGKVSTKDGAIHLERGNDMTGLTWSGPVVRMDYEITLETMRVDGSDFFCALTFTVDANSCSLVLGGWGGSVCGISNLDYYDAANNETTAFYNFDNGKWYSVKVVVRPDKIMAWVGDEEIVNVEIAGRHIDTRFEVDLCKPLGLATWQTSGAVRNIWVRKLPPQSESADESQM